MPPCGVWRLQAVPANKVDRTVAEFQLDNPTKIEKTKNPDGTYDVVATFPACPDGSATNQPQQQSSAAVVQKEGKMPDPVKDACEACFAAHADDCSGFVKAVGGRLGVALDGLANSIVDTIRGDPTWTRLADGIAAAERAAAGKLVIGGLRGDEQTHPDPHGHVVVVVSTPAGQSLAHGKYPFAYWGRLGGGGKKNTTVNWAWREKDRDNVTYAAHELSAAAGT